MLQGNSFGVFPSFAAALWEKCVERRGNHFRPIGVAGSGSLVGYLCAGPVGELFHDVEFAFGRSDSQRHRCVGCGSAGGVSVREEVSWLGSGSAVEDEGGQIVDLSAEGIEDQGGVARGVCAGPFESLDDRSRDAENGRRHDVGGGVGRVHMQFR